MQVCHALVRSNISISLNWPTCWQDSSNQEHGATMNPFIETTGDAAPEGLQLCFLRAVVINLINTHIMCDKKFIHDRKFDGDRNNYCYTQMQKDTTSLGLEIFWFREEREVVFAINVLLDQELESHRYHERNRWRQPRMYKIGLVR